MYAQILARYLKSTVHIGRQGKHFSNTNRHTFSAENQEEQQNTNETVGSCSLCTVFAQSFGVQQVSHISTCQGVTVP